MYSLEETYNQAIRISHNIIEDIRFGRNLYIEPINVCSVQICTFINDDTDILSFLSSVQDKYPYMYSHPVDVAFLSLMIGRWLNLEKKMLEKLVRAGLLHDIGKAKVKDSILNKTEILTKEEMEKLKSHPLTAYKILENIKDIETEVLQGVLFHHERMDGSGYPLGLKEEKINLFSRIIAIADVFDAITANKAYRPKSSPLKALDEIQADSKRLDTEISNVFIKNIIEFYIGKAIRLSNEQVANIVKINPVEIARPVVTYENAYLDLSVEKNIEVVDFI